MQTADLSVWCGSVTRIDPEYIFHMHTIDLHLLLYISKKQDEVTWSNWLNFPLKLSESNRRSWSKGPEILFAQPYLCDLQDGQQTQSSFQSSVSLGTVFSPQLVSVWNLQGSALLALKKPDSLKYVETSTQRGEQRDCQNTSIMAL